MLGIILCTLRCNGSIECVYSLKWLIGTGIVVLNDDRDEYSANYLMGKNFAELTSDIRPKCFESF